MKVEDEKVYSDTSGESFFRLVEMREDVTRANYFVFLVNTFFTICFLVFFNALQAFLLTEVYVVDINRLGSVTGTLALADEIFSIAALYLWGVASDFVGRRVVVVAGYCLVTLSFIVIPFGREPFPDLLLIRLVYAAGAASLSCSITALVADYTQQKDVGKASGLIGLVSGLAALFAVFVLVGQIPKFLCVGNTYFVAAGISGIMIIVATVGLRKRDTNVGGDKEIKESLLIGFKLGIENKRLGLSYIAGFLARGGSVIVTVYISAWVNKFFFEDTTCFVNGTDEAFSACNENLINADKRTCPAAFTEASRISGITQTVALIAAPFFGILGDKFNEVGVLAGTALLGVVSYSLTAILQEPTDPLSNMVAAFWGVSEIGMIVVAQFLVTRNMPEEHRGAVAGSFSLCGAFGIIFITYVGGLLFDEWYEGAPFILAGIVSGFIFLAASYVWVIERQSPPASAEIAI